MPNSRRLVAALVLSALAISGAAAANLPRPSPDFAINLGPGRQLKLSQYKDLVTQDLGTIQHGD